MPPQSSSHNIPLSLWRLACMCCAQEIAVRGRADPRAKAAAVTAALALLRGSPRLWAVFGDRSACFISVTKSARSGRRCLFMAPRPACYCCQQRCTSPLPSPPSLNRWLDPECYSLVLQPFFLSPAINVGDVASALELQPGAALEDAVKNCCDRGARMPRSKNLAS